MRIFCTACLAQFSTRRYPNPPAALLAHRTYECLGALPIMDPPRSIVPKNEHDKRRELLRIVRSNANEK